VGVMWTFMRSAARARGTDTLDRGM
jgi:hypothetical protein